MSGALRIPARRGVLLLACLTFFAGCEPARSGAHGRVTLDGAPLDEAAILFVPLDPGRKKTGAAIVEGSYDLPLADGLLPGRWRVEIADNPPLDSSRHAAGSKRRQLPPRYAQDSPWIVEIDPAAVETSRELDYDLTTR